MAAALAYLQKSRVAHTLKDLEKSLPSAAQVNGMQVKGSSNKAQSPTTLSVLSGTARIVET